MLLAWAEPMIPASLARCFTNSSAARWTAFLGWPVVTSEGDLPPWESLEGRWIYGSIGNYYDLFILEKRGQMKMGIGFWKMLSANGNNMDL